MIGNVCPYEVVQWRRGYRSGVEESLRHESAGVLPTAGAIWNNELGAYVEVKAHVCKLCGNLYAMGVKHGE